MEMSVTIDLLRKLVAGAALVLTGACSAQDAPRTEEDLARWSEASLWDLEVKDIDGQTRSLSAYRGKVAVIVNLASRCGYTPQYAELQALHDAMKDKGVVVLGFPCNDFGGQEPGTGAEIKSFCTSRYGVEFPLFQKVKVKAGSSQSDVYGLLGTQSGKLPGWNFCKYVVGPDGKFIEFFPSNVSPRDAKFRSVIEKALPADPVVDPSDSEADRPD